MTTHPTIDAYRQPAKRICDTCQGPAFARCPRCGRLLCLDHMPFDTQHRCERCEVLLARTRAGIVRLAWSGMLAVLSLAGVLFFVSTGLSAITALLGFAAVGLCGGLGRLAARRRFLARGRGAPILLADIEIPIGPRGEWRPQSRATLPITRIEPPNATMPMWQRTYGVG